MKDFLRPPCCGLRSRCRDKAANWSTNFVDDRQRTGDGRTLFSPEEENRKCGGQPSERIYVVKVRITSSSVTRVCRLGQSGLEVGRKAHG